MNYNN